MKVMPGVCRPLTVASTGRRSLLHGESGKAVKRVEMGGEVLGLEKLGL
jgi:hypothetical protein